MRLLTLEDFDTKGKTVFLRVDMNSPIDPKTMEILETSRIRESTESLKDLGGAKVVIASHQGRVGNKDYTGMESHAKVLEKILNHKIKYVQDVIGSEAQKEIKNMKNGDIKIASLRNKHCSLETRCVRAIDYKLSHNMDFTKNR